MCNGKGKKLTWVKGERKYTSDCTRCGGSGKEPLKVGDAVRMRNDVGLPWNYGRVTSTIPLEVNHETWKIVGKALDQREDLVKKKPLDLSQHSACCKAEVDRAKEA